MVTTFVPLLLFSGTMLLQRPVRVIALELVAANPKRLENSADGSGSKLFVQAINRRKPYIRGSVNVLRERCLNSHWVTNINCF